MPRTIDGVYEADPPEFDRSKVPDGPLGDYFFDGRTGRGLTNAEWDESLPRVIAAHGGKNPFREEDS